MARRRTKDGRKPQSKPHRTFAQLMPKVGFNFGDQDCFLRHVEKTRVRNELKTFTPTLNGDEVDKALSILVEAGVAFVDGVDKVSHLTFWHGITINVKWANNLTAEIVFTLIVVLIRAHEEFERNLPDYFHPSRYGRTAKAIHLFVKLLKEKYADNAEVTKLYFSPLPALDDEGNDTDVSIPVPAKNSEEEFQANLALGDPFGLLEHESYFGDISSDGSEEQDEDPEDDGYPNPYRPRTKPHGASGVEKALFGALNEEDEEDEEEVDEDLYQLQQKELAEARARFDMQNAMASGDKMEVDTPQGALEQCKQGGSQINAQSDRTVTGKRSRDDEEEEVTREEAPAASKRPRVSEGHVSNGLEELVDTMRVTGL